MKNLIIAITLVLTPLVANEAKAGWQFTEWGMTMEEVTNSAPEGLFTQLTMPFSRQKYCRTGSNLPEYEGKTTILTSDWKSGDINFTVCYYFDDNKLIEIDLIPISIKEVLPNQEYLVIQESLEDKYGTPSNYEEINSPTYNVFGETWEWETEKEVITFINLRISKEENNSVVHEKRITYTELDFAHSDSEGL